MVCIESSFIMPEIAMRVGNSMKDVQNNHLENIAQFFHEAIRQLTHNNMPVKLLDFGCGAGQLVQDFCQLGYNAYGCDVWTTYAQKPVNERLSEIQINPYRLPFEDNHFDIVVSTSVLEHAQNTEECFQEIYRVLKPGGTAMHLFPGKWYLPSEPHIYVPLANWFWPYCPNWWLMLWAMFGIRNEHQQNISWQATYLANAQYCQQGLCYRSSDYYEKLSLKLFKNFSWPMKFYIQHAPGGLNKILRKLPFQSVLGMLSKEFRMGFLMTQKELKP